MLFQHRSCFVLRQVATDCGSVVESERGIYGWWFSAKLPAVPLVGAKVYAGWRLLYVGIAPSGPTVARRPRTLRSRLRNHCRGPLATSTLRRTLACLLSAEKLRLRRRPSGKLCMTAIEEARLTGWMEASARVAWLCHDQPWLLEDELIEAGHPRLPLNIKGSSDPFRVELRRLRSKSWVTVEALASC